MATDKKTAKSSAHSMILRLSRGRTLKVTFRPRIRLAKLLVKLLAAATGLFTLGVSAVQAAPPVNALPTGGQVVYGNTSFQQTSNTLNVNQASQNTIINWQSFDIGAQSIVNFNQPNSSSVALNRILGNDASQIYGQLNANGHVFLLNPNGMLFAPSSQVNVGGLMASTMHMSDSDFIAGNYRLSNAGAGFIDSQGNINANSIAFVGNNISNSGNLYATNVSLLAGNTVAVDISGDGLIRGRVESPALQASLSNSGNINAVQQVTMSAGQSRDTINSLVNNSGIIRATGLSNQGGVITLQGGKTLNSGVLDASSSTGKGGTVKVLGEHVGIVESGSVIASGATGGGTILVGGDFQGKNPDVFNADRTFVGANTTLNADAINTGNGGKVIVWADDITRAYGDISARGGAVAGNGGFVEVSGKQNLDYRANTDTRAPNGQIGTLLLDPDIINIVTIGGGALTDVDQFADNPGLTINLFNGLINTATSNVLLQANLDINFNAPINMTGAGVGLTAQAGRFIVVNLGNTITTNGGAVAFIAGDPGATPVSVAGGLILNAAIDTTGAGTAPNGANVLLSTNLSNGANSLVLNSNINAGTAGDVILTDNSLTGFTQLATTGITASSLSVKSIGSASLAGANNVTGNLAANITGAGSSFTYNSNNPINVGTVGVITGITTSNGNATLTSSGNLNVNKSINLGTGDLSLTAQVGSVGIIANGPANETITARNITASALTEGNIIIGDAVNSGIPNILVTGDITLLAQDSITGGNIDIAAANISHIGATNGTFTANAENNIVLENTAITSTGSQFAVTLASNFDTIGSPNGTIALTNSSIDSNGGNITLGGGAGAAGYANSTIGGDGINLNNSSLNASGGNIALRGRSETSDGLAGVFALDSTIATIGAGTISIDGIGAPFSISPARGAILMNNTNVSAVSDITLTGATTNANLSAVRLIGGTGISNSTGNINITGSSFISTAANVAGIEVIDSIVQNTLSGDVTLTGTSTGTGPSNRGILLNGPGTLIGVADGALAMTGDASSAVSAFNSDGILINGGAIVQSAGAGSINVIGKGASGGINQAGIAVADAGTKIQTLGTSSGNISLNGEGNGTGPNNFGVVLFNGAAIASAGTGNVNITAQANNNTSAGLAVDGPSTISAKADLVINAGNIGSVTDQIRFDSAGLASITGVGAAAKLFLTPTNLTEGIAVGGNGTTLGAFNLQNTDLAAISNFSNVVIGTNGPPAHTGAFEVAAGGLNSFTAANNNAQISLQSSSANMNFLGATSFSGNLNVIQNGGAVTLSSLNATNGAIGVRSFGDVVINAGSSIVANKDINIAANYDGVGGGNFINNAGAGALSSTTGRWRVYSFDVAGDVVGGLVYNFKEYNYVTPSNITTTALGTGNGLLYGDAPVVTANLSSVTKGYDGTTGAPATSVVITSTGAFGDTVAVNSTGATFTDKNAGTGKLVTASGLTVTAIDGAATVYGYQFAPTTLTANVGTITPKNITVAATGTNKPFDGLTTANVTLASAGLILGDVVNLANTSADFLNASIGTSKQIDVIGITLSGADAGNYNLLNVNASAIAFADITGTAPTLPAPTPSSNGGTSETDRTEADTIDKTQNLELVLLPVKVKLPTEEEYLVSTGVTEGKELSCK